MEPQMSNYEEVMSKIRGMGQTGNSPTMSSVLSMKAVMSQIIEFLKNELPKMKLDVSSSDATNVSRDILELNRNLQSLQGYMAEADNALGSSLPKFGEVVDSLKQVVSDFEESARCVEECISDLQSPVVNVENVNVKNLSEVVSAITELIKAVNDKEGVESVEVSNLKDISFPKEFKLTKQVMEYLSKLELLSDDPKSPLSVRLSDGEEFTKAIADGVRDGVKVISHGSSGNVFIDANGSPVKPQLDVNGNLPIASSSSPITSASVSSVNDNTSSQELLSSNTSRRGFIIYNDSTSVAYVKLGTSASSTSFTYRIASGGTINEPNFPYTGVISCAWASDTASGAARITELS